MSFTTERTERLIALTDAGKIVVDLMKSFGYDFEPHHVVFGLEPAAPPAGLQMLMRVFGRLSDSWTWVLRPERGLPK